MKVFQTKEQLIKCISHLKSNRKSIGLVPTMGALHEGHASLIKQALRENDQVVVSVFVNPTQFDKQEDLIKYPRDIDKDVDFLEHIRQDLIVYAPEASDIYDGEIKSDAFDFNGLEVEMEGKHRIGHFDGVGSVVKRLLELVKPDRAYFGEKDFQQLAIIRQMVAALEIPVQIVGCPIYREDDGLAMSSRNKRLKPIYRDSAPFIYQVLTSVKNKFGIESANSLMEWVNGQFRLHPLLKLEYFEIADIETLRPIKNFEKQKKYRAFIAVWAEDVRLIDNIALN